MPKMESSKDEKEEEKAGKAITIIVKVKVYMMIYPFYCYYE